MFWPFLALVLGIVIGLMIGYYAGRREALLELGNETLAAIKRKDALEHRRTMQRYMQAYRAK